MTRIGTDFLCCMHSKQSLYCYALLVANNCNDEMFEKHMTNHKPVKDK